MNGVVTRLREDTADMLPKGTTPPKIVAGALQENKGHIAENIRSAMQDWAKSD